MPVWRLVDAIRNFEDIACVLNCYYINMIKQSLQKIDKLIRERSYPLPQLLLKLHTFLLHFARKIVQQGDDYAALQHYAEALKLFRNYLVEQPFKLTRIALPALAQALQTDSLQPLADITALRNRFLKELAPYNPSDPFARKTIAQLADLKWAKKLAPPFTQAEQLRRQLDYKRGCSSYHCELTVVLWFGELKGEYLVHVDSFLQKFMEFVKQYFPVADFIDRNSFEYLRELCDPERKYFLTAHHCDQLFIKLRQPEVITKLWQLTQQKNKDALFSSESSMVIRLTNSDNTLQQIIGITGQKLIDSDGVERDVALQPAIMVGSASDCDLQLKSKYISRKQMLIIEDRRTVKQTEADRYSYSIVCLSLTNFTSVRYQRRTKAAVGLIFFGDEVKYQIVGCQKESAIVSAQDQEDERTLSLLPSEHSNNYNKCQLNQHKLTLLILSGEDKQKEVVVQSKTFSKITEIQGKHLLTLKAHLELEQFFYLKPNVKILAKTTSQILEGRTSRKLRLSKGMQICLDDYTLYID